MSNENLNISDSVITGDVTNIIQSNRVTCEQCKASGNLTIFNCSKDGCENKYCEHCKNSMKDRMCISCRKIRLREIDEKQVRKYEASREKDYQKLILEQEKKKKQEEIEKNWKPSIASQRRMDKMDAYMEEVRSKKMSTKVRGEIDPAAVLIYGLAILGLVHLLFFGIP